MRSFSKLIPEEKTGVVAAAETYSDLGDPKPVTRRVIIFQPAKSTMQAGLAKQGEWQLQFKKDETSSKWENPLMGWTSGRDPYQGLEMTFATKEEAIKQAESQGWQWECREAGGRKWGERTYAENFIYSPTPLRFIRTK